MMHLSQVWNLLTAAGGVPYYFRPNFPQGQKYYPTGLPLISEPFNQHSLRRFIFYELPSDVTDTAILQKEFNMTAADIKSAFTVGRLYEEIRAHINDIPEKDLFIGNPELQAGPQECHFNEITRVVDRASANRAIDTIMEEGEGSIKDQLNCHYGLFLGIDQDLIRLSEIASKENRQFIPARNTVSSPITAIDRHFGAVGATLITHVYTGKVAGFFDDIYSLMLRTLQFVFSSGWLPGNLRPRLADIAIQVMTRVLKPAGEALTLLPAYEHNSELRAGPAFGLYRHVPLPADLSAALVVIRERFAEIIADGEVLTGDPDAPVPLKEAVEKLKNISSQIKPTV